MVLKTFSFFTIFKKSYKFSKNVKSYWFIHFNNFFTSRNPPKSTTTKIWSFFKLAFSFERCRRNQFWHSHAAWRSLFFWSAPSVGARFSHFATPPQRECHFFHFFNTSNARSSKILKNAILHTLNPRHGLNGQPQKCYKNPLFLWREIYWSKFEVHQNLINVYKKYWNYKWISTNREIWILKKHIQINKNRWFRAGFVTLFEYAKTCNLTITDSNLRIVISSVDGGAMHM